MSIVKGDPDELAMFTDAMDFMAKDISDKIGEMEHVIDSTTGMLADLDAKNGDGTESRRVCSVPGNS